MPDFFKALSRSGTRSVKRPGLLSTPPTSLSLAIDGQDIEIRIVRSAQATRLTLRQDIRSGGFRLTLPLGVSMQTADDMVRRHSGWLAAQIRKSPQKVAFEPGVPVPVCGRDRLIRHDPETGHRVIMSDDALTTGGDPCHVPRRVEDFLRLLARDSLGSHVRHHAQRLGRPVTGIAVRDTVSRWGSCSSTGRINLSWRLILAPEWIASYVAAHEVAHLAEMNHGPRFWRLCRELFPETDAARAWLRHHGTGLHRYGGPAPVPQKAPESGKN
ncbi:M48 family metallopeptidase [Fodinicurvata sp. EGI_FJ10296]|uniref:M48 family metallopeptidase n=1 Tax=Fodinicurvata sp. EGI_FJ10296 TaxID=3231908 RepID=UPI00345445DC